MPYDGSGNYIPPSAPTFPAVSGTVINSTYYNTVINDIATALNNVITRDGQGKPLAAINWNAQNLSNVATLGVVTLTVSGNATIAGTLGITGALTLTSAAVSGNVTVGGTLGVTGLTTLTTLTATGAVTFNSTLAVTGALTGAAGTFSGILTANSIVATTTIAATGNITSSGNVIAPSIVASTTLVGRGGASEGGQVTLGYVGQTSITGPANSTWNTDVDGSNNFRIFRLNGAGTPLIALTFVEASGDATLVGDLTVGSDLTITDAAEGHLRYSAHGANTYWYGTPTLTGFFRSGGASFSIDITTGDTSTNGYFIIGAAVPASGTSDTKAASTAFVQQERKPRVVSVASTATLTPTFASDMFLVTAQAAAINIANPTGTAIDGHGIVIRIKDNGTARAITYGGQYRALGVTLPTTTVINKTLYLGAIFNSTDTRWDVVSVQQEA